MSVESTMYFALGCLAAGLLALMIVPAIWQRAVRLTKARIEAASPMTLTEFRADKDQLRAEFALSTRRLEKNVDALRARLAGQLGEIDTRRADLAQIKADRDRQAAIVEELESREAGLHARIQDLEKTGADIAQRLRMRNRDFAELNTQLEEIKTVGAETANAAEIDKLRAELETERTRAGFFEARAETLAARLELVEVDTADAAAAVAELRKALAEKEVQRHDVVDALTEAEGRMASAEVRLNALLQETHDEVAAEPGRVGQLLAEKLSSDEELHRLREKVAEVENAVMNDWEKERLEQSHLRERLNDIASSVSRLVYAVDGDVSDAPAESLFDKVRKFAGEGFDAEEMAPRPARGAARGGSLAKRMAALRDLQPGN